MEVELFDKFLLDARADATAKQRAVGNDNGGSGRLIGRCCLAMELAHDELKEEKRRFSRLAVFGKVPLYSLLLFSAEWRIGEDHIDAFFLSNFGKFEPKGIAGVNLRSVQSV